MLGPPARQDFLRKMEADVQPALEPATVTGVGATSVSVIVGHMGGMAAIIDYMGPDDLAVGDYVNVRKIPRDPFGRYEMVGRRVVASPLGATTHVTNDPVTGAVIPPSVSTTVRITSIPTSVLTRITALEARLRGHAIVGPDSVVRPQRNRLKFIGDFVVTDDAGDDSTVVSVGSAAGINYNASDLGYNDLYTGYDG